MALKISFLNSICSVQIDNREAGQSFGLVEAQALAKLLKSKAFKQCSALIWTTPSNGIFCSGGNLKYYQKQTSRLQGIKSNRQIAASLKMLSETSVPTVALVDGDCFGGGVELLSAFDIVLSTPKSFFGLWQRRIGLTFGWGGGARIERRLSSKKMIQLSLLAKSFSAYEAAGLGLVDDVVPKSSLEARAYDYIAKLNQLPPSPFGAIKVWSSSKEKTIFEKLWFNKDHRRILGKYR